MERFLSSNHVFTVILVMLFMAGEGIQAQRVRPDARLKIGEHAPDFSLRGIDGKTYTLESFSGSELLVLIFTANHCPTAQAYESRIQQLYNDYSEKSVAVVAVSPNDPKAVDVLAECPNTEIRRRGAVDDTQRPLAVASGNGIQLAVAVVDDTRLQQLPGHPFQGPGALVEILEIG